MRLTDFSHSAVAATVAGMPETFRTKDVAHHPRMKHDHGPLLDERGYNSCVGRYLSIHRSDLGLTLLDDAHHDNGVLWQRK